MKTYLDDHIYIDHYSKYMKVTDEEFEELWNVEKSIESTPNPMNKKYMIRRKQCTYVCGRTAWVASTKFMACKNNATMKKNQTCSFKISSEIVKG